LCRAARPKTATPRIRQELAGLARPQVMLGLLMTVFGFAGVFAIFTYIQPILTQLTGFSEAAVSPILLVFGGGIFIGNLLGGRLADRGLRMSLLVTLGAMALVLGVMGFVLHSPVATVLFVGLLGVASFATVAPLQMRVLQQAHGAGQNLAASLNIGAFNVGNALGAWLGGLVVSSSFGLGGLSWLAALITVAGIAVTLYSLSRDKAELPANAVTC
jgi:DHA1 family inner membrane transport protein